MLKDFTDRIGLFILMVSAFGIIARHKMKMYSADGK